MFNLKMLLLQTLVVCCFISKAMQNAIGDVKCNKPADIYFVLDASSSIWGPDYKKQLEFVNSVIRELDLNVVRCGLLTYGNAVREEFGLRTYAGRRQALTHAVSTARQLRGDTHTDKAIRRARERMLEDPREEVPRIIVVMTDGKSNEPGLTKREAQLTHRSGITTFAIGIGKSIDQNELKSIASHEDYLFTVDTFDALVAIKGMLREKACEVKFVPQPVELPQNTEGCRERPTDVVLMLDSSSSVRSQDFGLLLKFTNDLISDLPLSTTGVRVGVATYSNIPKQQFSLGQHTSPDALSRAVNRISQQRGRTNMATALRHLIQHSFSTSQASNDLRKIAIIVTSSPSDRNAETSLQAQLLHEHNIQVFAVGVGPAVDRRELETIASYPTQQHLMTVDSFSNLQSLKEQIVDKICSSNDKAALSRGDIIERERGQKTTTTSTTQESTTETTPTPMPTTTTEAPSGCGSARPADIVFAISSAANSYEATEALEFISSFAERMIVTPSAVRIGLAPRNCLSLPGFMLDQGTNKAQLLRMFETNYPESMRSETASTIRYLRNISFKKESGARENAKKIGVLIIDGPVRNFVEAVEESVLAKKENIELFLIGVGSQTSVEEMTLLASSNSQHTVMTVSSYSHLKHLTKKLIHSANQRCISQ